MIVYPQQIRIESVDLKNDTAIVSTGLKEIKDTEGSIFGGYGWTRQNWMLGEALSRAKKKELASVRRLYSSGQYAELFRRYGTSNPDIIRKIIITKSVGSLRTERTHKKR